MNKLFQMKISNGDEILAEFLDDDDQYAYFNNALMIERATFQDQIVHTLRPWVTAQYANPDDDKPRTVAINPDTIVGTAFPSKSLEKQYKMILRFYMDPDGFDSNMDIDSFSDSDLDMISDSDLEDYENIIRFNPRQIH